MFTTAIASSAASCRQKRHSK
ncbi:hypothetical protein ACFQ3J_23295 [Paenibacillus provencensis]|uniref:Uncharacterized protein n=1 Tax=Paenibacillus provencensis TaxID=441151 RepID=A0ABW3PYH2_9BACL